MPTLKAAWQRVEANGGAAGEDKVSTDRFGEQSSKYLEELSLSLREGTYKPQPVRRTYIPKGGGKMRPLTRGMIKLDARMHFGPQMGRNSMSNLPSSLLQETLLLDVIEHLSGGEFGKDASA